MQSRAAVAWEAGKPLSIESIEVDNGLLDSTALSTYFTLEIFSSITRTQQLTSLTML